MDNHYRQSMKQFEFKKDVKKEDSLQNQMIKKKVLPGLAVTNLLTLVGIFVGKKYFPIEYYEYSSFVLIGMLFFSLLAGLGRYKKLSSGYPMIFVYLLGFLMGVVLQPTFENYLSVLGADLFTNAIMTANISFVGLGVYAYFSDRDFSVYKAWGFIGLITLIILSIIGIFIESEIYHLALSFFGIMIFSLRVLIEVSAMKQVLTRNEQVPHFVLNLYLIYINFLLRILDLFTKLTK